MLSGDQRQEVKQIKAEKAKVNREFKDGMFRTLFNDKEKMLELYNAVSEKQMGEEALENIETLTMAAVVEQALAAWFEGKEAAIV